MIGERHFGKELLDMAKYIKVSNEGLVKVTLEKYCVIDITTKINSKLNSLNYQNEHMIWGQIAELLKVSECFHLACRLISMILAIFPPYSYGLRNI